VASTAKIRDELGYREIIPVEEALRRTIDWERANPPATVDSQDPGYAEEDRALKELGL
jgi:dTDP-D-glucose 4,6-dehydratase